MLVEAFIKIIKLLFAIFEAFLQDATILGKLLTFFWRMTEAILPTVFVCLPEMLAGIVFTSIGFIICLKIVQYH